MNSQSVTSMSGAQAGSNASRHDVMVALIDLLNLLTASPTEVHDSNAVC